MPFSPCPGTKCRVCLFERVHEVNTRLLRGESVPSVAAAFGLPAHTLYRHRQSHLPSALKAAETREVNKRGASLLEEVLSLQSAALAILKDNRAAGSHATALAAIREATRVLELRGRISGEIPTGGNVTVIAQLGVTVEQAKWAVEMHEAAAAASAREVSEEACRWLTSQLEIGDSDAERLVRGLVSALPVAGDTAATR